MPALPAAAGAELYVQRVAKAAALPPESRIKDCAAFLSAHDLLEEAAAVLLPRTELEADESDDKAVGASCLFHNHLEQESALQHVGAVFPAAFCKHWKRFGHPATCTPRWGPFTCMAATIIAQAEASGPEAAHTLALLKWLSAGTGVGRAQPLPLQHPALDSAAGAAAALAPLVSIQPAPDSPAEGGEQGSNAVQAMPTLLLEQLLRDAESKGPLPDLLQTVQLLLLGRFWLGLGQRVRARAALAAASRAFGPAAHSVQLKDARSELAAQDHAFMAARKEHRDEEAPPMTAADEAAAVALACQLAALQEASGGEWQVPSAAQLHGMLLHLRLAACMPELGRQGSGEEQGEEAGDGSEGEGEGDSSGWALPKGEAAVEAAQRKRDALALPALLPEDPRSHDWAAAVGVAAVGCQVRAGVHLPSTKSNRSPTGKSRPAGTFLQQTDQSHAVSRFDCAYAGAPLVFWADAEPSLTRAPAAAPSAALAARTGAGRSARQPGKPLGLPTVLCLGGLPIACGVPSHSGFSLHVLAQGQGCAKQGALARRPFCFTFVSQKVLNPGLLGRRCWLPGWPSNWPAWQLTPLCACCKPTSTPTAPACRPL